MRPLCHGGLDEKIGSARDGLDIRVLEGERASVLRHAVRRELAREVVALWKEGEVGVVQIVDQVSVGAEVPSEALEQVQGRVGGEPGAVRQE
eukprot:7852828-Pyramimonas_sp.AAC.1